jgi:hypothetical protein
MALRKWLRLRRDHPPWVGLETLSGPCEEVTG